MISKDLVTAEQSSCDYVATVSQQADVRIGMPLPMGAHVQGDGVNFTLFSRNATRVWLELFEHPDDTKAARIIDLDPRCNRTGDVWHVWIKGIQEGQLYTYRVDGEYNPQAGHRFDFNKHLLDPMATAITALPTWDFNSSVTPKCIFMNGYFQWQDYYSLKHSWSEMIIYETHVRGFTIHPSANVAHPGTYRGLIEKIPYLKDLGITAIELMPVQEFNSTANYWGYNPIAFLAPKASYSSAGGMGQQKLEFKEMVQAFHQAGIEVILDVVFNHTAEGNENGPTFCFRGIDNDIFYMLEDDKQFYKDYTGTGNTINANHPIVRDYILNALHYWVIEMHVDGFRFDLAAVLCRDPSGKLLPNPPVLEQIAEDPILRDVKIIAEGWDIAGAYKVGSFSEKRWTEWNGQYRDDVRRFWRGDSDMLDLFIKRICGSPDIYTKSGKGPNGSINFITCHDGFTLNDLVSYKDKHNQANGENNHDGSDTNFSENYGVEGDTSDEEIVIVRKRQIKNFILTLLVSRGTPMLTGGDEFCRTQNGNNNAYCQDNEISWINFQYLSQHEDIFRFTRGMIAFRKAHPVLSKERFYDSAEIDWFNVKTQQAACLIHESDNSALCLLFNASVNPVDFALPKAPSGTAWYLAVDTGLKAGQDLLEPGQELLLDGQQAYSLHARASAILITR